MYNLIKTDANILHVFYLIHFIELTNRKHKQKNTQKELFILIKILLVK